LAAVSFAALGGELVHLGALPFVEHREDAAAVFFPLSGALLVLFFHDGRDLALLGVSQSQSGVHALKPMGNVGRRVMRSGLTQPSPAMAPARVGVGLLKLVVPCSIPATISPTLGMCESDSGAGQCHNAEGCDDKGLFHFAAPVR
jgi:hypothetical protein